MSDDFKKGLRVGVIATSIICAAAVIVRDLLDEKSICDQISADYDDEDYDEEYDYDDMLGDEDEEASCTSEGPDTVTID